MDPTIVFCPNWHCPARGQISQGNIGIHAQKEQRVICHTCHKPCSARKGTVCYRLRTSADTVVSVVTWLARRTRPPLWAGVDRAAWSPAHAVSA
jgi:transposase-like protein